MGADWAPDVAPGNPAAREKNLLPMGELFCWKIKTACSGNREQIAEGGGIGGGRKALNSGRFGAFLHTAGWIASTFHWEAGHQPLRPNWRQIVALTKTNWYGIHPSASSQS